MDSIVDAEVGDLPAMCDLLGILFTQEADFTPDRCVRKRGCG